MKKFFKIVKKIFSQSKCQDVAKESAKMSPKKVPRCRQRKCQDVAKESAKMSPKKVPRCRQRKCQDVAK
jgi:hypothetical protein